MVIGMIYLIKKMKMIDAEIKYNIKETRNLNECMEWVKGYMSSGPDGEDYFVKWMRYDETTALVSCHHGFGTFIRNTFELWSKGPAVKWFNDRGIYHADDMSAIIFTSLHRRENKKYTMVNKQIKHYRAHWELHDPKVNKGEYGT